MGAWRHARLRSACRLALCLGDCWGLFAGPAWRRQPQPGPRGPPACLRSGRPPFLPTGPRGPG
eukprot:1913115-Lingulodinium_polyedra.AAC.1